MLNTKYFSIIFGLMFILVGNILPKIPQNYLVGIKTVWGYKNDDIWTKTQRLSSKLWIIAGFIMIISNFSPWNIHGILNLSLMLVLVIVPNIYGMILQRKIDNISRRN